MVVGEFDRLIPYLVEQYLPILVVKWRNTSEHLVNEYPEAPPIDGEAVLTFVVENLRGKVLSCSDETICLRLIAHLLF